VQVRAPVHISSISARDEMRVQQSMSVQLVSVCMFAFACGLLKTGIILRLAYPGAFWARFGE